MTSEQLNAPRAFPTPDGIEPGMGKRMYVALHVLSGMYASGAIAEADRQGVDYERNMRAAAAWAVAQADILAEELSK